MELRKQILTVLFAFILSANIYGQETQKDQDLHKTEQTKITYSKGDKFEGQEGEIITLIKTKKLPHGIIAWKTKWELNGRKKTVYVPETYLKDCKKINTEDKNSNTIQSN